MVAQSCSYHAQAIRHIRHLLSTELAQTLACSLILSRIDFCNAVLHGAPTGTIQKLQRVQHNAAQIVFHAASVASPAVDHIQVGSSDLQSSQHIHSGLRALSNHGACLQPNSTFCCHTAAGPTVHQDTLFHAYFPTFSTVCLELTACYRRTGLPSDKQAYLSTCLAAHDSILKSHANCAKAELNKVSGDVSNAWQVPVLHREGQYSIMQYMTIFQTPYSIISLPCVCCQTAPRTRAVNISENDSR